MSEPLGARFFTEDQRGSNGIVLRQHSVAGVVDRHREWTTLMLPAMLQDGLEKRYATRAGVLQSNHMLCFHPLAGELVRITCSIIPTRASLDEATTENF